MPAVSRRCGRGATATSAPTFHPPPTPTPNPQLLLLILQGLSCRAVAAECGVKTRPGPTS